MKTTTLIASLWIALLACTSAFAADDANIYYTQFSFFQYKTKYITTNYHVGTVVPINTRVKITDIDDDEMTIALMDQNNEEVEVENAEKYSRKTMEQFKALMLGTKPVELSSSSPEIQKAIKAGELKVGMTKQEVLQAYGYPPAHATPSLDSDKWLYWMNKMNRIQVRFEADKLKEIVD